MITTTTGTILIVDDDEDAALLLRDMLRRRGFGVEAVHSGRKALDRLDTAPADVVVTDVQMPGMSGIELCLELNKRHADQLSIVITGRDGAEIRRSAIDAGAYAFMTKPVEADALALTVGQALTDLALRREQRRLDRALAGNGVDA